jgi:hypothetical protein
MSKRGAKKVPRKSAVTRAAPATSDRAPAKEARYRIAMRRRGFRLLSIWVPDTRSTQFRTELRRQSALIARAGSGIDDAMMDAALADVEGWTA